MRRWPLIALTAGALVWVGFQIVPASEASGEAPAAFEQSRLFDTLEGKEDVIYLLTNSSFVWGPDPNDLSEEITFTGLVTVPKWPMAGYQRRVLPDGRQQIDIELTESLLVGESYLLGGKVNLLEHPDLRSLGTITEPAPRVAYSMELPPGIRPAQLGGVRKVAFAVSDQMARVLSDNPSVPWETLIAREMARWAEQADDIRAGRVRPQVQPAAATKLVELKLNLPAAVARRIEESPDIDWNVWLHETLAGIIGSRPDIVVAGGSPIAGTVIPSDFVVARKVLLNTAKGLLYNETAVPVRGKLDSIPPVKREVTPQGVNIFLGMELPVPLLNGEGAVDGWFYSKAHTALSVRPRAVERAVGEATVEVRVGDRVETVVVEGPVEIHHGSTRQARGKRETDLEVVMLGLRGRSELLGGNIMIIERYGELDHVSGGRVAWESAGAGSSGFDLYVLVNTPAGVLGNEEPIRLSGRLSEYAASGALTQGSFAMPLVGALASYTGAGERPLLNDAEQPVASLRWLDLRLRKDGPHVDPSTLAHRAKPGAGAATGKGTGSRCSAGSGSRWRPAPRCRSRGRPPMGGRPARRRRCWTASASTPGRSRPSPGRRPCRPASRRAPSPCSG
jgi:hypothetical protein